MIEVSFGKEEKIFAICSAFIKDDFFATSNKFPEYRHQDRHRDPIKVGKLPHINSRTGETLIHYLYTNEYKVTDDINTLETVTEQEELLIKNVTNLLAAEMCNLSKLENLIRLEIEKLILTIDVFKSILWVGFVLRAQDEDQRIQETAKSREWLRQHLKIMLEIAINQNKNWFDGFHLSDFTDSTPFVEEMGSEMLKLLFGRIVCLQAELLELKKRDENTQRMLEESMTRKGGIEIKQMMADMIQMTKRLSTIENELKTPCHKSEQIDGTSKGDISPKEDSNQHSEKQTSDNEDKSNLEENAASKDSDEESGVVVV